MDIAGSIALLLGGSWASGVNLYLSIAGLGISHRMGWFVLPADLEVIAKPIVIGIALLLFVIEFIADKIPAVDSVWDSIHTFIRPLGGALLGYLATSDLGPVIQILVAILTGGIALESHLTKATARVAINTSPEPLTNSVASVTEDVSVGGILYLIIAHPVVGIVVVLLLLVASIWFLKKMTGLIKKIFGKLFRRNSVSPPETDTPQKQSEEVKEIR
jgi:hypothetical protein